MERIRIRFLLKSIFTVAARGLGLFLMGSPLVFAVIMALRTFFFPPQIILNHANEFGGFPYPYWGLWYLFTRMLIGYDVVLPNFITFASGLWLFFGKISWKNTLLALLILIPWFFYIVIMWSYGLYGGW